MGNSLIPFIYVFLGGGAGSVCRYLVAMLMQRSVSGSFPYGTLTVNVVGAFVIGFIITYIESRAATAEFPYWRNLLVIGFLGGFTTFSSFSWDTLALFKNHEPGAALLNISANLLLCLGAAWAGMSVAK